MALLRLELIQHPAERRMLPVLDLDPVPEPAAAVVALAVLGDHPLQPHQAGVELRMREWPSIVPSGPEDYYVVVNRYGRFGAAFVETDLDRADFETTIADLMVGQHRDPLRVVRFNTDTDRAEDVSHAIAQEILRRGEPPTDPAAGLT